MPHYQATDVACSHHPIKRIASCALAPQTSGSAVNLLHTAGRSALPKIWHSMSTDSCTQRCPAGLPSGIPGIGEEMEGAMQQAPQPGRHSMETFSWEAVRDERILTA